MGGLFSSNNEREEQQRLQQQIARLDRLSLEEERSKQQRLIQQRRLEQERLERLIWEQERLEQQRWEQLRLEQQRLQVRLEQASERRKTVKAKYAKLYGFRKPGLCENILKRDKDYGGSYSDVEMEQLNRNSEDYRFVSNKFRNSTQKHFKIVNIEKVWNPYLRASYLLRNKEYSIRLDCLCDVTTDFVFHGTKNQYSESIWRYNFDWRKHGASRGNIFGKGASFTPISNYASNYCDDGVDTRVMFGVHVLVGLVCNGNRLMTFPPPDEDDNDIRYDTSQKPDGHVLVKYMDDEFYPSYLISFKGYAIKR